MASGIYWLFLFFPVFLIAALKYTGGRTPYGHLALPIAALDGTPYPIAAVLSAPIAFLLAQRALTAEREALAGVALQSFVLSGASASLLAAGLASDGRQARHPVVQRHGELDEYDNVPVAWSVERLEKAFGGKTLTLRVYAGVGHSLMAADGLVDDLVEDLGVWLENVAPPRDVVWYGTVDGHASTTEAAPASGAAPAPTIVDPVWTLADGLCEPETVVHDHARGSGKHRYARHLGPSARASLGRSGQRRRPRQSWEPPGPGWSTEPPTLTNRRRVALKAPVAAWRHLEPAVNGPPVRV